MTSRKELRSRIYLIILCLAVCILCIYRMNQYYDPLARYPYVTEENRDILLKYLDNEDIDYLINQQLKPDDFMEFITYDRFNIRNSLYYRAAKDIQDADDEYIINFVNRFRSNFSLDTLKALLTHYTYLDLTTYYENEAVLHSQLRLISDPSAPYVILNSENTVYKYAPDDLVTYSNIQVQSVMVDDLDALIKAYGSVMNDQDQLTLTSGYLSYEQILEKYVQSTSTTNLTEQFMYSAGENEQQLGYTIVFDGYDQWNELCISNNVADGYNYEEVLNNCSEEMLSRIEWLKENAYRYGFVIRYDQDAQNETGHWYQPFMLRYVGKKTAKNMKEDNLVMEQTSFPKKIE